MSWMQVTRRRANSQGSDKARRFLGTSSKRAGRQASELGRGTVQGVREKTWDHTFRMIYEILLLKISPAYGCASNVAGRLLGRTTFIETKDRLSERHSRV